VEGELNLYTDTKTHIMLYNEFKELGAIDDNLLDKHFLRKDGRKK